MRKMSGAAERSARTVDSPVNMARYTVATSARSYIGVVKFSYHHVP